MNHARRGKAVIISNENFPNCSFLKPLNGSHHSVGHLILGLQDLGFEIDSRCNLSKRKIIEHLEAVAGEDHSDADCVIVAVMSHGNEDGVCGTDYDGVRNTGLVGIADIVDPFKGDRCPSLAGKPKIFIMNTCRGSFIDQGVEVTDGPGSHLKDIARIPISADILVCFSCCDGHISHINEDNGSFFIYCLGKMLYEYGEKESLADILLMVKDRVAKHKTRVKINGKIGASLQMPVIDDTLRKKVFFGKRS